MDSQKVFMSTRLDNKGTMCEVFASGGIRIRGLSPTDIVSSASVTFTPQEWWKATSFIKNAQRELRREDPK